MIEKLVPAVMVVTEFEAASILGPNAKPDLSARRDIALANATIRLVPSTAFAAGMC
jgi:hypothetical protein